MYASKTIHHPLDRTDHRALRIVVAGTSDALQRTAVTCLRASLYRVFETTVDVGLTLDAADDLRGFDMMVVVATIDPEGALALVESTRERAPDLPIIMLAHESAYLVLWPRTAELEVTAFYSLSADLPRFLATVDELLLAPA